MDLNKIMEKLKDRELFPQLNQMAKEFLKEYKMELKYKITEIVKNNALFEYYRDGNLYYTIIVDGAVSYTFPIDITDTNDIGNATFDRSIKGITLMRYIRKAIAANTIVETNLQF